MTATNAVAPRTGNVSAGTSIFSMVVLERPLQHMHEEIDLVTTPAGKPVAMVHCNNCTNDTNAWADVLDEAAGCWGDSVPREKCIPDCMKRAWKATRTAAACWCATIWPERA